MPIIGVISLCICQKVLKLGLFLCYRRKAKQDEVTASNSSKKEENPQLADDSKKEENPQLIDDSQKEEKPQLKDDDDDVLNLSPDDDLVLEAL